MVTNFVPMVECYRSPVVMAAAKAFIEQSIASYPGTWNLKALHVRMHLGTPPFCRRDPDPGASGRRTGAGNTVRR